MISEESEDALFAGRSGFPGQFYVKVRGKAYRGATLIEAFNLATWMVPDMTPMERLEQHMISGVVDRIRFGKSSVGKSPFEYFATLYCNGNIDDTGAHATTPGEALALALDALDDKLQQIRPALPLPKPALALPVLSNRPIPPKVFVTC